MAREMEGLTRARLDDILERARGLRVAVVGDVMLDVYLVGSVSRISPEAPVPVVHVTEERFALGGAANVSANVAALGAECRLVGLVGADHAGQRIRASLAALDGGPIHARLVERADRPTTTRRRGAPRSQQVVRFDHEHAHDVAGECADELCAAVRDAVAASDALVLED